MEFKVGQKVTVVNYCKTYDLYKDWIDEYGKDFKSLWKPSEHPNNGQQFKIVALGKHMSQSVMLYLISNGGQVYIIGEQGIEAAPVFTEGQKVRVRLDKPHDYYESELMEKHRLNQETGTIESVNEEDVDIQFSGDPCTWCYDFESIEEVKGMFKIGDKVEVLKGEGFPKGTIGEITEVDEDDPETPYRVDTEDDYFWQAEDELKLVTQVFTKADLKTGMLVYTRSNEWMLVQSNTNNSSTPTEALLELKQFNYLDISLYSSDLLWGGFSGRTFDIMKVATVTYLGDIFRAIKEGKSVEDIYGFTIIYQRESAEAQQTKQEIADLKAQLDVAQKKLEAIA